MSIRQLNASYAPEEDRVMLRFTTDIQEEYRFWLTRAVVAALLQHAQTLAVKALEQHHSAQQAKAVAHFKQQTLAQTATFTQFEGATRFPFGAEPVLVKSVEAHIQAQTPVLVLHMARGQKFSLRLNEELMGKLQLLLKKMSAAARWALDLPEAGHASTWAPAVVARPESGDAEGTVDSLTSVNKVLH